MQLIIGLGNPGKEYAKTRHNAGFMALDYLAGLPEVKVVSETNKFDSVIKEFVVEGSGEKNFLVYPQTFMNDSGKAVKQILNFYKLGPENILVLHDEIDLPLGTLKFTEDSSAAGHNGVKSLIDELGTQAFRRIRIGVESRQSREEMPTEKFVLQNFSEEELKLVPFGKAGARVLLELR